MYVLRLVLVWIFIVASATCSFVSLLSYDSSDITVAVDEKNPCNATRECLNCKTSRLCIPANDKFQQVATIACDANPATPYCDWDTGLCTSVAPNGCNSKDFICPSANGAYPDPASCTRYHICVDGYRTTNVCPPNNVYDHALGDCRLRRCLSCDCVVVNCQGQEGKVFVYPKDDRIYGSCVNGRPYFIGRCKDYEKYDVNLGRCVRVCRGPGNQPSEECQKYVRCAQTSKGRYEPVLQYCPCDKGFDEDAGVCTKNATCMKQVKDPCKLKPGVQVAPLVFFDEDEDQEDDDSADDPRVSLFIINNSDNKHSQNNVSNGNDDSNGNIVNGNGNSNNSNDGEVGNVEPSRPGLRPLIINNSDNNHSKNKVTNGNDESNGNIVNGNDNGGNSNSGNVGNSNSRSVVFIINNAGNSESDNGVSNGDDSDNGNIVNGNDNSNNSNEGDVGNVKPSRPGLRPFIINNSENSNSDSNVSNGNDSENGNIVNGNGNKNNDNKGNVGNEEVSRPCLLPLIINNANNNDSNNSISNGDDSSNGNIVNGNDNGNNSNSGNVGNSNSRSAVLIINNAGNSDSDNKVSNGDDSANGNIVNGNDNSNNGNEGNVGNVKPSRPGLRLFIINNSGNSDSDNQVSNGNDNSNGNIVNGNDNQNNANEGEVGNVKVRRPGLSPLIISNSDNDSSSNKISNGNDNNNGNIINGNGNENNSNSGDVGN